MREEPSAGGEKEEDEEGDCRRNQSISTSLTMKLWMLYPYRQKVIVCALWLIDVCCRFICTGRSERSRTW